MKKYIYIILTLMAVYMSQKDTYGQSTNCVTATSITLVDSTVCVNGTTSGAVPYDTLFCNTAPADFVWYTYVTTGSANLFTITPGTLTNAEIVIYLGGCPSDAGGVQQLCKTAAGAAVLTATWGIPVGTQVWIGIASNGGADGTFQLCVKSTIPPAIGGQDCSTAIPLCNKNLYTQASMAQYGPSPGPTPSCFGNPSQQDMFIQFTITKSGTLAWTATPNVITDEFDWCLWDITAGCPGTVACCNYDYANGSSLGFGMQNSAGNVPCGYNGAPLIPKPQQEFSPTMAVTAGSTYVIQFSNYNSTNNGFTFSWTNSTCLINDSTYFTINPNTVTCANSVTVNITDLSLGVPTYSFGDGSTTYTGNNPPPHVYTTPGTYAITATIGGACPSTYTQYVKLYGPLIAKLDSVNISCAATCNGKAGVSMVSGGDGIYTYAWNTGSTANGISNLCAGTYTCTISNAACASSVTKTVTVVPGNGLSFTKDSTASACTANNGSASITMTSGTAPFTYKWSNGATTSNITGVGSGSYCVNIVDSKGCKDSTCITVPSTGNITTNITNVVNEPCFGDSLGAATANVVGGISPYSYAWTNGETASNATGLKNGSYTVTVTDANGCKNSSTAKITQPTAVQIKATAINTTCNGKCDGQLIAIPSGGTATYTYLWSNTNTAASQLTVCAGTYSLVVTDANGCKADSTGLVVGQPTAVQGATTTTAANCGLPDGGACVTANGGTGTYTYSWNTVPAQTTTCATNMSAATYSVIIQDANKCPDTVIAVVPNLAGDTAVIISSANVSCNNGSNGSALGGGKGGTAPYTYSWSTTPVQTNANATGLKAGTYTLSVRDQTGCVNTTTVSITQPAIVVATPGPAQTICIGDSATITVAAAGGTSPYTYSWVPGGGTSSAIVVKPTNTTIYKVIVTDSNKCVSSPVGVLVTVNPKLTLTVSSDQSMCPGGSVSFTATAGGGDGIYTYSWAPGGYTSSAITVSPSATTVYTVTVSDACGTAPVKDSVTSTVNPQPVVHFTADTTHGCSDLCVQFTNTSTNGSSWLWDYGDGNISTSQNPTLYCYGTAGIYTVSLFTTSAAGCKDSLIIPNMITVYSHPNAAFTASPQPAIILDPTVYFKDQSTDAYGPIASWLWDFGDPLNGSSTNRNTNYTYPDTGKYCVTLTVANKYGCLGSTQQCIIIEPVYTFYIPNAFTPNHDGENDVFMPYGTYICGYEMYIFDRWGQQLYHTFNINAGWDGVVEGKTKKAEEDTYIYLIKVTDCIQYNEHQYIGKVSLVK